MVINMTTRHNIPLASLTLTLALLACTQAAHAQYEPALRSAQPAQPKQPTVELPLVSGWYEGRVVQYITTDVSDKDAAKRMGANYVPRLAYALPAQPRVPGQPSAVERIYSFTNFKQGGVLPSIPEPTGADSTNQNYSPLWQVHTVTWLPGQQARVLRSEEEVLAAADKGQVAIKPTNIVVNCPVLFSEQGGALPRIKIKTE